MKDKYGLSYKDIQGLLDESFGISLTQGGAAHSTSLRASSLAATKQTLASGESPFRRAPACPVCRQAGGRQVGLLL
jgi:hypothetical protein